MMKEIVCQVITYVAKDTTTKDRCRSIPVVEEDSVSQLPERNSQHYEKCWWHYKPVFIHWQVVMNTVEEKVSRDANAVVRQVAADVSRSSGTKFHS